MNRQNTLRFGAGSVVAVGLGAVLALGAPLAASAHAALTENTAEPGTLTTLQFEVPNESSTASTTRVQIDLPVDTPYTSVRPAPLPGWQAEVVVETLAEPVQVGETTITEAPTSVVWTATEGGLRGEELGLFTVRVGPIPDVDSIAMPIQQSYDDGSVTPWEGDEAPVLYVNAAPAGDHGSTSGESTEAGTTAATGGPDVLARAFGVGGLVVGAVGVVLAVLARRGAKA